MRNVLIIVFSLLLFVVVTTGDAQDCCIDIRGNVDYDPLDEIDISDLVFLVDFMFNSGAEPQCADEADINGEGNGTDISDLVYLVAYMFDGGPQPADCIPDTVTHVIVPLAVGNIWLYHKVEYNSSGTVIAEYDTSSSIVSDTLIVDSIWYIVEDGTGALPSNIATNWDDGLWTYAADSTPSELLALKFPTTIGDSYPYYNVTVHVDDTALSVTVPAGMFTCYYYRMTVPIFGTVGKIWVSPDIGIVKAENYELGLFSTYLSSTVELLSYTLVN